MTHNNTFTDTSSFGEKWLRFFPSRQKSFAYFSSYVYLCTSLCKNNCGF